MLDELPKELFGISRAIDESRYIPDWPDNWDGDGAKACKIETWTRATDLLKEVAVRLWQNNSIILPAPFITHGPDASIDFQWIYPDFELLLTIPELETESIAYYGERGLAKRKGSFPQSNRHAFFNLMVYLIKGEEAVC